jgi:hypothetical protein
VEEGLQLSARFVASILARIFGPSFYDTPLGGGGDPYHVAVPTAAPAVAASRFSQVMLNPQPLPPGESVALGMADAYIREIVELDRIGTLFGGEVQERAVRRSFDLIAEVDELCPHWPKKWPRGWPKKWPPPPPPPYGLGEEMRDTELFVYGARFLAAASVIESDRVREGIASLGERILGRSVEG